MPWIAKDGRNTGSLEVRVGSLADLRWQVRDVTQDGPASPFYAASLTKNAVGVFAHGKLRSPIF
jgi:hypothetical protein